jgi:hypothetical protein
VQNAAWTVLVERWREIESLGFDTVWLTDQFVNPNDPDQTWLEAWTLLAGLAARTERIRLGTLVTNTTLRHPAPQHYLNSVGRCKACGELFPCPSVDRLLRELHRKVQPESDPISPATASATP